MYIKSVHAIYTHVVRRADKEEEKAEEEQIGGGEAEKEQACADIYNEIINHLECPSISRVIEKKLRVYIYILVLQTGLKN